MNNSNQPISIVTVSDNQYCVMLAALLKSIEINSAQVGSINVYVVDDGISEENISKLRRSVSQPINLEFVDIKDVIKNKASLPLDSSSFPLNVYIRLFIPYFVPVETSKVIYLDVDMITKRDLSDLWSIDLQGRIIAAVADRCETIGSPWGGIRNYEALGLNPKSRYFNSGLLVIDVNAWRNTNLTSEILKCISTNSSYASFPDQYGLNAVFAEKWLELDQRWNCFAPSEISDPYIIHFIGIKPIFRSYEFNNLYKEEFFYYLAKTEWKDFEVLSDKNRLLKKLKNLIIKKGLTFFKRRNNNGL